MFILLVFPSVSASKESACSVGDLGSILGLRRCPGGGNGYPLQHSGTVASLPFHYFSIPKALLHFMWTIIKSMILMFFLSSLPLLNLIPLHTHQKKIIFGIKSNTPSLSHPSSSLLSHFHLTYMVSNFLRIEEKSLDFAFVALTSIFYLSSLVWLPLYVRSIDSYWACIISHEYMCTENLLPMCSQSPSCL